MKKNNVEQVSYDSGQWHIDADCNLTIEHGPHIDLTDDMWVELDVNGDFCKVMTNDGEVPADNTEQLLDKYEDAIDNAQGKIIEEYADGYRHHLKINNIGGLIEVVDTDWVNVHGNSAFVEIMAHPFSNQYIVRCLCEIS